GAPLQQGVVGGISLDPGDALAAALELKNYEFNAQGVEMNQRYRSSAVVDDPDLGEEIWDRDPELYLRAALRPGAKLPHAWVVDESGHRVSTLDLVGHGRFTLVTGVAGRAWVEAVEAIDRPLLGLAVVGGAGARDLYGYWARVRDIDEGGALLVRPDGYIAWRRSGALGEGESAEELLRSVLADVLGQ
ncbi:MAG: 2,4-dichlorophenol 6-monooxygenase, partial [Actinomycetota bacterium]